MNVFYSLILVSIVSFPGMAFSSQVLDGGSGYHQSGLLIGQLGKLEKSGIFIEGMEIEFLLGGAISRDRYYPTATYKLSAPDAAVFEKLKQVSDNRQVILRYVSPFRLTHSIGAMIFGAPMIAENLVRHTEFERSFSYEKYGYNYSDPFKIGRGWYGKSFRSGKFVRVFRWGTFGPKVCTADLHEGGEKIVSRQVGHKVFDGYDKEKEPKYRTTYTTVYEKKPNINHLNIFTEEGCRFAEDALMANKAVKVDVSTSFFAPLNWYGDTIHSISISDSKGTETSDKFCQTDNCD